MAGDSADIQTPAQLEMWSILDAQRPTPLLRPASRPWQGPTSEQVARVPGRAGDTKGKKGPTEAGPESQGGMPPERPFAHDPRAKPRTPGRVTGAAKGWWPRPRN